MIRIAPSATLSLLLAARIVAAHDFWIAPSSFHPAVGESVALSLRVGDNYAGEIVPRDDLRTDAFVLLGPDGTTPITGADRTDPAGTVTLGHDGLYIAALRTTRRYLPLDAGRFNDYLSRERLDDVVEQRTNRGESLQPGREVYSRCAKVLLVAGRGAADGYDRIVGLRLELILETNPSQAWVGAPFSLRLRFEDAPLKGVLVTARSRSEPFHTVTAMTDAAGRVVLPLDRAGEWMMKAVHMVSAPAETGAEWESLWATLTLEVPADPAS